ncbi:hypothetical protein K490DRAFT_44471 [Saccharata proteae CBS 121410]|uniref:Centromere protein Cenp-K n=1 Tax=Saccharata proteae CBS 121410 TaxID=1314787 RepID=A0A9P4LU91_9PEZI|nr:hypothetical protein K490DRAFT_44471 [Saccharata proteae CBS 121410]
MELLPDNVLSNIRQHAEATRAAQQDQMEVDASNAPAFEAHLERTVQELQQRVEKQQRALAKLRASAKTPVYHVPSSDKRERLRQVRMIQKAFERMTPSEPELPEKGSILPALLATRTTQENIADAKIAIEAARTRADSTKQDLEREERNIKDANQLTASLHSRIEALRSQDQDNSTKSPTQMAKDLLASKRQRKQDYDLGCKKVREELKNFIDDRLAAMLAAEELGGPVVGEILNVNDNVLGAGFSAKGKPKQIKTSNEAQDRKRQQRIDEIWGSAAPNDGEPPNEKDAASAEMHSLLDQLYEALLGDGGTGVYVTLDRDSAAARFLVRAKVAQFHPKDARRLRLVDFGRGLDD